MKYAAECVVCGNTFEAGRSDAVTCSSACRQARSRAQKARTAAGLPRLVDGGPRRRLTLLKPKERDAEVVELPLDRLPGCDPMTCDECGQPADRRYCSFACLQSAARRVVADAEAQIASMPPDVVGPVDGFDLGDLGALMGMEARLINDLVDAIERADTLREILDERLAATAADSGRPAWRSEHPIEARGEDARRLLSTLRAES